jgi:hypothetical protein
MICPVCLKPATMQDITAADYGGIIHVLEKGGALPKYATHRKCDHVTKGYSVCVGHITPPGLEELEKWAK